MAGESVFESRYTLVKNHFHPDDDIYYYETFGDEVHYLRNNHAVLKRNIWTVVDSDDSDDLIVIAGMHFVNRVCYLVTEEKWESEDEEYLWCEAVDA